MKIPLFVKQNKIIALVILNLIVLVLYVGVFFSIKGTQESTSLLLNEVETNDKKNDKLQSIRAILRDSDSDIKKLESYFIASDGIVTFIETIEAEAKVSGVKTTIDFVNVDGAQSKNATSSKETLRLRLSTEGSWAESMYFLSLLEQIPFQVNMERVSLVYSPESESSLSFTPPKGVKLPSKRSWKGNIELTALKLK